MATFGPPIVQTSNLADGAVTSAKIALDTIAAVDVATNAIGDAEIAAHTTTKITSPFSLVTGTVPLNQGGTGETAKAAAFDALGPGTTQGDTIYHDGSDHVRLAKGTALQVLRMNAGATAPEWAAAGTITFLNTEVYATTAPTSPTDLDLSGTVGAAARLVIIRCRTGTTGTAIAFGLPTDTVAGADGAASASAATGMVANNDHYILVKTNSSGVCRWDADAADFMTLTVVAYF